MKKLISIKSLLFVIFFVIILIFVFGKYDCSNKCSLWYAGGFLSVFLIMSFCMLFIETMRKIVFNMLQIYVPAMFVLFSAVQYFDFTQNENQLKVQKEYIDLKVQYASMEFKNVSKADIDKIITNDLKQHNDSFNKYINDMISEYKDMTGRAMIGLTVGCFLIVVLDGLAIYRKENENTARRD